jgi:hypothetical protein
MNTKNHLILDNNVPYSRYCNSEQESLPKVQQVTERTKIIKLILFFISYLFIIIIKIIFNIFICNLILFI